LAEKAFRVVKQELGSGIGGSLVTVLLHRHVNIPHAHASTLSVNNNDSEARSVAVKRVLTVVNEMICCELKSTTRDGVGVLARLVSGIGSSTSSSVPASPHSPLVFEGTSLNLEDTNAFASASTSESVDGGERMSQLTEGEIGRWWDVLVLVWCEGVGRYLSESGEDHEGGENEMEVAERKAVCVSSLFIKSIRWDVHLFIMMPRTT
jgi:hypothetical protein